MYNMSDEKNENQQDNIDDENKDSSENSLTQRKKKSK